MGYDEPPIPRPDDSSREKESITDGDVPYPPGIQEFRPRFWVYFIQSIIGLLPGIYTFGVLLSLPLPKETALCLSSVWIAGAIFATACGYYRSGTTVTADQLRRRGVGWTFNSMKWKDIQEVKPINLAGFRYIRVFSKNANRAWWIPLFLHDQAGFVAAVRRFTEPDNPLRQYFENRGLS